MKTKKCQHCHESFETLILGEWFCSDKCREEHYKPEPKKELKPIRCKECNRFFKPRNKQQKFCNTGCHADYKLEQLKNRKTE